MQEWTASDTTSSTATSTSTSTSSSASASSSTASLSSSMITPKVRLTTPKSLGIGGNTSAIVTSDFAATSSGAATIADGDNGDDDDDDDLERPLQIDERAVREVVLNEDEFLYPSIIRPTRSFEQKLKTGRVNVGGVHLNTAFAPFVDSDLWSGRRGQELLEQKEWLMRHPMRVTG